MREDDPATCSGFQFQGGASRVEADSRTLGGGCVKWMLVVVQYSSHAVFPSLSADPPVGLHHGRYGPEGQVWLAYMHHCLDGLWI